MSDWELLGIDPTSDSSAIKKAYAKKLKLHHPEDDPQGYQKLREAYDRALKYAKNYELYHNAETLKNEEKENGSLENSNIEAGNENDDNEKTNINYRETVSPNAGVVNDTDNVYREISEFFNQVSQLYHNFLCRIELKYWEELLNSVIIWNLDTKEIVNREMLSFLSTNYFLPRDVWKYLNSFFDWNVQEEYIRTSYNEAFADYLFLQIGNDRVPRYYYLDRKLNVNYDEYIYCRETAFIALLQNDLNNANTFLLKAAEIYAWDPDLYCLKGEFYIRIKDYQRADYEFQTAINMRLGDMYIYYYKANVYYNEGLYNETLNICQRRNNSDQYYQEFQTLIGKCYFKQGKLKKAEKIFINNIRINHSDSESGEYLRQIAGKYLNYVMKHRFALGKQMKANRIIREIRNPRQTYRNQNSKKDIARFLALLLALILFLTFAVCWTVSRFHGFNAVVIIAALLVSFLALRGRSKKS